MTENTSIYVSKSDGCCNKTGDSIVEIEHCIFFKKKEKIFNKAEIFY